MEGRGGGGDQTCMRQGPLCTPGGMCEDAAMRGSAVRSGPAHWPTALGNPPKPSLLPPPPASLYAEHPASWSDRENRNAERASKSCHHHALPPPRTSPSGCDPSPRPTGALDPSPSPVFEDTPTGGARSLLPHRPSADSFPVGTL